MSKVVEAANSFAELYGNQPGVVAVSGGADSVALVRAISESGKRPIIGHFNHRLRGDESDADEAFVRDLADELGLACHVGTADVAAIAAEHRRNLEATARRLRYDWLSRLARSVGGRWVATGHTANDQAETLMHRLVRGTGVQGLRGILVDRPCGDDLSVYRPYLWHGTARSDVLEYLTDAGHPYREDSSNADDRFTRNRIRHELMPVLEEMCPDAVSSLNRLADYAVDLSSYLRIEAGKLVKRTELPRAGNVLVFDASHFGDLELNPNEDEFWAGLSRYVDPFLVAEMFRYVWEREDWPMGDMSAEHWKRVVRVARGRPPAADFPGGVHVRRVGSVVQLSRKP